MTRFKYSPILFTFAALVMCLPTNAKADCTGSGATWSCTAGSSSGQIQNAVNSASDGATITLANGSYSLSSEISLDNRNGITIICATVGGCNVSMSGNNVFTNDSCVLANKTNLIRISGMKFTGSVGTAAIWLYGNCDLPQVRIDNNDFSIQVSAIAILFGETSHTGRVFGVVDHNNCHGTNNFMCMKNISGAASTWLANAEGTSNNLFFENNTCNFNNMPDNGTGCIDVWRGNGTVARFNTMFNGRIVNHSYCHEGPYNSEIYGNTINTPGDVAPQYRNIHWQGSGQEIAFGNTVETDGSTGITVQHFRGDPSTATSEGDCNSLSSGTVSGSGSDASNAKDGNRSPISTNGGYPSWRQPGRDVNATLKPVYVFMNHTAAGAKVDVNIGGCSGSIPSCYIPAEFAANRDYFNAVSASAQTSATSPFNGTSGVGFGSLANRPTTCTNKSQAQDAGHGGVGYWATDQGNWNQSGNGFGNGVLYTCTATNTWTLAYTPYTYPHPLVSGGGGGNVNPPTGLQATVQ